MDEEVMIAWVNEVLAPYVATAPDHVIPVLIIDMYRCHMMALVVQMIQAHHRLLFLLNHQPNLTEAHHHVLRQHHAANLVLLARAALATHLGSYNLDDNTAWMDGLAK
jgi:hypothetical protein